MKSCSLNIIIEKDDQCDVRSQDDVYTLCLLAGVQTVEGEFQKRGRS